MLRICFSIFLFGCVATVAVGAESQPVYRCGNAYTNQPDPSLNCQPLRAAHVTVIEGTRVQNTAASPQVSGAGAGAGVGNSKVDSTEQRQRDTQAQAVLQAELHKAQQQKAELQREWNNGEPERRADEFRQAQKYQDRVAQLRASLQRIDADIAGLQRELSRLSVTTTNGTKP
jgi:hypothetical protein